MTKIEIDIAVTVVTAVAAADDMLTCTTDSDDC